MHGLINQLTEVLTERIMQVLGIEEEAVEDNWDEDDWEDEDDHEPHDKGGDK